MTIEEYIIDRIDKLEKRNADKRNQISELIALVNKYEAVLHILKDRLEPTIEYSDFSEKFFIHFKTEYIYEGSPQYEAVKEVFYLREPNPFPETDDERKEEEK